MRYFFTFRQQIKQAEEMIRARSKAAEADWSCDKWQQSWDGQTTTKVLNALDALDRHSFDKTDPTNNLDTLYAKIFTTPVVPKDGPAQGEIRIENVRLISTNFETLSDGFTQVMAKILIYKFLVYCLRCNLIAHSKSWFFSFQIIEEDEPIVEILCEWAVSSVRYGEHRAMAVAMLLEKRQAHLTGDNGDNDDKDSVSSGNAIQNSLPIFQGLLMKFLDNDAPILGLLSSNAFVQ